MNKFSLFILLLLFIGFSGYVSGLFYIMIHEQAHVSVFNKYEIDSIMRFDYLKLGGSTAPDIDQYINKCNDYCKSDQLNIDAIGYHLALLIFSFHILVLVLTSFYIFFIYKI